MASPEKKSRPARGAFGLPLLATFTAAIAVLLGGCGWNQRHGLALPAAAGLEPVTLALNWYAEAAHGGFYQALLKGHYRDAGLDVHIVPGSPAALPLQRTVTGQVEFAIDPLDGVILAANRGLPVAIAGVYQQTDPQAVMFHASNPIRSLADLDRKAVMAGPQEAAIEWLQARYQIKLNIIPTDFGVDRFLRDPAFIQKCYVTSQPFIARQKGADVKTILLSESGFDPPGVVYTNLDLATRRPELVRRFMQATLRGWHDYLHGDRADVHRELLALNQANTPELLDYSVEAMRREYIIEGDPARGRRLGRFDRARFGETLEIMRRIGLLTSPPPVERMVPAYAWNLADDAFHASLPPPAPRP